jgi:hypothetical protein
MPISALAANTRQNKARKASRQKPWPAVKARRWHAARKTVRTRSKRLWIAAPARAQSNVPQSKAKTAVEKTQWPAIAARTERAAARGIPCARTATLKAEQLHKRKGPWHAAGALFVACRIYLARKYESNLQTQDANKLFFQALQLEFPGMFFAGSVIQRVLQVLQIHA